MAGRAAAAGMASIASSRRCSAETRPQRLLCESDRDDRDDERQEIERRIKHWASGRARRTLGQPAARRTCYVQLKRLEVQAVGCGTFVLFQIDAERAGLHGDAARTIASSARSIRPSRPAPCRRG